MNKVAIMVFILGGLSFTGFSQEQNETKPERIKLYPVSTTTTNSLTPAEEIANCESQIQALDLKEEKIKQSPEETKLATENGWFVQAEETRKKLIARIEELKK